MLRLISMIFSLVTVVIVSAIADIMPLNGKTTVEIANRLPVYFTPASYVFGISAILYVLLAFWLYGFWRNKEKDNLSLLKKRGYLFNLSAMLNVAWVFLWHYELFNWTVFVMAALLVTVAALYFTYPKNENLLLQRIPISVYLGWVIVTFFINSNYLLTLREWSGWGLSASLWTVIFLTIATAIALHFMYHHRDLALNSVFIWALIGIAAKNGFDSLFISSAALFLTAVIGVGFFFVRNNPTSTN